MLHRILLDQPANDREIEENNYLHRFPCRAPLQMWTRIKSAYVTRALMHRVGTLVMTPAVLDHGDSRGIVEQSLAGIAHFPFL